MKMVPGFSHPNEEDRRLWRAAGIAVLLEALFFLTLGLGRLPFWRNPLDSDTIPVQILQLPTNSHLTGAQAVPDTDEVYYNPHRKHPKRKKAEPKKNPPKAPEQNQVEAGPALGPTHGPVALYAPAPVIPAYLRNQNLKTSVVIEFLITAQGQVTPRLLESSGSDELDSIALDTVKRWKFKPAAKDNQPVDSKTRLRIVFEVYG
jgi:periplasmic protein TonB